jgi:hypothetical protein
MKRTLASVNSNRDISLSRSKRARATTATQQKENIVDVIDDYDEISNGRNVLKKKSGHIKETLMNDKPCHDDDYDEISNGKNVLKKKSGHTKETLMNDKPCCDDDSSSTSCKPTASSISFSSTSSNGTSSSTNHNKKTVRGPNQQLQSQQTTNGSTISRIR